MILTKKIEVKIVGANINHYKKLGYVVKCGTIESVLVDHLPKKSNLKVKVKCDICGCEKDSIYRAYLRYIQNSPDGKYRCTKCNGVIRKKTLLERYGDENYTNVDKYNKTLKERYGGHYNKLDLFKEKIKKSNLDKYGVDHPMKLNSVKEKFINTNLERYGVKYPLLNEDIKNKALISMNDNYGATYSMQVEKIKEKIITNSKKTKINNLLNSDRNILNINYDENLYTCWCIDCSSVFEITPHIFTMRRKYKRPICTNCNPMDSKRSGMEIIISDFIKQQKINVINSDRSVLSGRELDIYLPDLKLAFEFNGLYWHSELYKEKNYHIDKTKDCFDKGVELIHIWEDDWNYKQDIIKSIILNKLGSSIRIFARKCVVKEITDNKLVRDFLFKNHIQGFIGSKVKLGLFYNDELVSLMTFGSFRKSLGSSYKENSYELLRFCNKINTSVIGGASKLFSFFIKSYKPKEVISYSDNSRGVGNLYKKLGFEFVHETKPNYYWVIDGFRRHRFNFRKDKLIKEGFDKNKTEIDIMRERGYYRIFDCGCKKFIYKS